MQVKIVRAGLYMNDLLKAQKCQAGDVLVTREWYAQQMATDGSGEIVEGGAPQKQQKSKMQKKSSSEKTPSAPPNPFLE